MTNSMLGKTDCGATMIEYVLMLALLCLVCVAGVANVGIATSGIFQTAALPLAATSSPGGVAGAAGSVGGSVGQGIGELSGAGDINP